MIETWQQTPGLPQPWLGLKAQTGLAGCFLDIDTGQAFADKAHRPAAVGKVRPPGDKEVLAMPAQQGVCTGVWHKHPMNDHVIRLGSGGIFRTPRQPVK